MSSELKTDVIINRDALYTAMTLTVSGITRTN